MAMEFTYKVSGIKVYSTETQTDIIKEATLHIIGTEDGQVHENFMQLELAEPSGSFTEFSSVTETQVQEWLKGTLGEDQIELQKASLASLKDDPLFISHRDNPVEKELVQG